MQLWFSRQSDISIREQLATQIVLAIVSGELTPGQRLPSTRELARRFRLHPNTVSAGYKQLEEGNWLEFRKGSGVYVRATPPENRDGQVGLDRLIGDFFRSARKLNTPLAVVRERLRQWLDIQPPDHFLLIEPDLQLAQIVLAELKAALSLPVKMVSEITSGAVPGAIPVVLSASSKKLKNLGSLNGDVLTLHLRSARESLSAYLPVIPSILVGIASGWPPFIKNASTMLVSAGFHPDCLLLRDTSKSGWKRGLLETAAVVCDSMTASTLDGHPRVITFALLSQESIDELRRYEQLIRDPLMA
jgi:DNA-binding transcriptional regulator YhcF (GntR family)